MFAELKSQLIRLVHIAAGCSRLTCAAIGVGLVVAFLYFKLFFGDWGGFKLDIENEAKIPLVDKDYDFVESRWSYYKILLWLLISVGSGLLAYYQLPGWFPRLFR